MFDKFTAAHYAAALSTLLAIVKLYEVYQSRFRLDVYFTIDGPDSDKCVVVTNLTSHAIHVKELELYFSTSRYFAKKKFVHIEYDLYNHVKIDGRDSFHFEFKEGDNFGLKSGKKLYARFNIAGARWRKVYKLY